MFGQVISTLIATLLVRVPWPIVLRAVVVHSIVLRRLMLVELSRDMLRASDVDSAVFKFNVFVR